MAMNTPIGNITQITPITSFVTLGSVSLDQYILGINNFTQGDGSKITLQNLIASMVNTTNEKNILGLDENGRLQAIEAVNPFGNDNGWAIAPTLSVNWTNRTVSGTGGKAYKDGFEITALNNFISPVFGSANGEYYLYYDVDTENLVWATSKPTTDYLIAKITVDSNSHKMAGAMYRMGGVSKTVSDFLNKALGTIVLSGGDISNVTKDEHVTTNIYPQISTTTIGTTDFNYTLPALTSNTFTGVKIMNNQLVYSTNQNGIVPLSENNLPVIIDSTGLETEIADGCALNIWLVGLPLFGESPSGMTYQFVTGSNQYEGSDIAKASSPNAEIAMQYIDDKYDRYAIIARFTILREGDNWLVADFDRYNPLSGGGGAGSIGITEVISDPLYFSGLGIPSSPLTMSEETKDIFNNVIHDKENIYKIIEGHKSHDGKLWNLIEYHDATDKDVLLLGGTEETYTSNTSSSNYHFGLLNSIVGTNQPSAANALLAYKLFNNKFVGADISSADSLVVNDGTLTISCAKKMRISKIEIRSYNTYYTVPQLHVCALNRENPLASDVSLADFANARYIGGQSITKEPDYVGEHGAGYAGANRPCYFNLNEKDYYNTYFLCFDNWCSGTKGWSRSLVGVKIWGSQEETQDSDFEVGSDTLLKVCGDYDVLMSGKGFNKNAFAVVGNPTITRKGIASGFSNNNYLKRVQTFDFNKPFIINAEFVTGEPDNAEQCLFHFENLNSFTFRIHSDNRFILYYPTSTEQQFRFGSVALSNTKYFLEIEYDLTKLTAKLGLSKDNMQTFIEITNADFSLTQSNSLLLGITLSSNRYWKGSIDLKHFSITIDGENVLDGGIGYEDCKWISSNGTVYNTKDLIEQYGKIPQERVELDRWISCFGHRFGYSETTKAVDNYYPCLVSGKISYTGTNGYSTFGICRQTDYMPNPRTDVGYNTTSGIHQQEGAINTTGVWEYLADSTFPAGEYFWEMVGGYNNALISNLQAPDQYNQNKFTVQCLDAEDNVVYQQSFGCEGSMYDKTPLYRTPRFYIPTGFKKVRVLIKRLYFPNVNSRISQMQMYYRDIDKTNPLSFVISPTEYDLSCNVVRHVTNVHFFITPTGIRVGSNCFVRQIDPLPEYACVGNRWINEDTELSYVCNKSGFWEREDFCELCCMMLWGTEHKGMFKRRVSNEENPITHYVQDYGNLGGQLCFDDDINANQLNTFNTDPEDQDFYFVAETKAENEGIKVFYPSNHLCMQSYYRQVTKSKIYESGQQYTHWSNNDNVACRMIAYKTFETEAAGEYIESEDIS